MSMGAAIFLGFIQGVAEFLPISSSGHLVLGKAFLGLNDVGMRLDIFLHVGTLASVFAFDTETVVISLLGTYLNGIVVDHFIFDLNPRRRVCILSEKEQEICRFILDDLHSGASIYQAIGAYTGESRREIITIVDKTEYRLLMDFIRKADPDAFITVYPVHEVHYKAKT